MRGKFLSPAVTAANRKRRPLCAVSSALALCVAFLFGGHAPALAHSARATPTPDARRTALDALPVVAPERAAQQQPTPVVLVTLAPPGNGSPTAPTPSPAPSVITYLFRLIFPADTIQQAIINFITITARGAIEGLKGVFVAVLDWGYFGQRDKTLGGAFKDSLKPIMQATTSSAVVIWAMALVILMLSVTGLLATGQGAGPQGLAGELWRWVSIAFVAGNAFTILSAVDGLASDVARMISIEHGASATDWVNNIFSTLLEPGSVRTTAQAIAELWMALFALVLTLATTVIMFVAFFAQFVMLYALFALAPIAISLKAIPATAFLCDDWVSMFWRVQALKVINMAIMVAYGYIAASAYALDGAGIALAKPLVSIVLMIGLCSVVVAVNMSVVRTVFGTAISVANSVAQLAAGVVAMAVTGGAAAAAMPALAGAGAATGAGAAIGAGSSAASASALPAASGAGLSPGGSGSLVGLTRWAETARLAAGAFDAPVLRGVADGMGAGLRVAGQAQRERHFERMSSRNGAQPSAGDAQAEQAREAAQIARDVGASSSTEKAQIAQSIVNNPHGISHGRMKAAHEDNIPLARSLIKNFGSGQAAAEAFGQPSYGALMSRMGMARAQGGEAFGDFHPFTAFPSPSVDIADTGYGKTLTPYDYAAGERLNRAMGVDHAYAAARAQDIHALRTRNPEIGAYEIERLIERAGEERWNQARLKDELARGAAAASVADLWQGGAA